MDRRNRVAMIPMIPMILAALIFTATYTLAGAKTPDNMPDDAPGHAVRRAEELMAEQRWNKAAVVLDEALLTAPDDHDLHLQRGRCALGQMELSAAGEHFEKTLSLAAELEGEVALSWRDAALRALKEDKLDRAVAMFAKAFYRDQALGDELGALTIEAAQKVADEDKRAGYMTRAVAWAGIEPVLKAGISHYSRTFGPPRRVYLENPGWVEVARLRPGDEFLYLSGQPFQQRDAATIRIVPAAVTQPIKLTVSERDTKGGADTLIRFARHQLPTSAYIWLLPGAKK